MACNAQDVKEHTVQPIIFKCIKDGQDFIWKKHAHCADAGGGRPATSSQTAELRVSMCARNGDGFCCTTWNGNLKTPAKC